MKFSTITALFGLAAFALAAPAPAPEDCGCDDEPAAVPAPAQVQPEHSQHAMNDYASSCNQKGGSAYCCDQVTPAGSVSSLIPINLNVLVQCIGLIISSPICATATVCCQGAPQDDPALVGIADGAQVCAPITL